MTERAVGVTDVASGSGVVDYRTRERSVFFTNRSDVIGSRSEGTTTDFILTGIGAAWSFTASATKSVKRIWIYPKVTNPGLTAMQMGIYSDSAGVPGTRLGFASVDSLADARSAQPCSATFSSPISLTSSTTYWLAIAPDGEQYDFQGTTASGAYSEDSGLAGVLPSTWAASATGGTRVAIWAETEGESATTVNEQYLIEISERVKSGVYSANTGRNFLTAAAHGATSGYWFLINPSGSGVLLALRHAMVTTGLTATGIALATSPRLSLELFTYTGTPSGATITPGKLISSYGAAAGSLRTASTGMTITSGAVIRATLPVLAFSATTSGATMSQTLPSYVRDFPTGYRHPTSGDPGTVVLASNEGILLRQADAGSTSEATHRLVTADLVWEEYTLP